MRSLHACCLLTGLVLLACWTTADAADSRLLLGFETPADVASMEIKSGSGSLSDQHVTQGAQSLRVPIDDYVLFLQLPGDWSGFDALEIDVYCESTDPASLDLLIGDAAWQADNTYWNRHNASHPLRPGANTISIPLGGLYRGEAGSRNNDIPTNIDVSQIVRLDLGFTPTGSGGGFAYLDNLRLARSGRPQSVQAFDFGPADQSVAPGFTAVERDAPYSEEVGWGWGDAGPSGRDWDVTFPTRLLQDSIDMGDAAFRLRLPAGRYAAHVFFEPLGYWGGEQAQFTRRTVHIGDASATTEHAQWGRLDHVYRFQDTEPRPGDDLWLTYMDDLFRPVELTFDHAGGACDVTVEADGPLARRIAALIVRPANDREAEQWTEQAVRSQRDEFNARAVELPLPETADPAPITESDRARGCVLFVPRIEQPVFFSTRPTADQLHERIAAVAARGELRSLTAAVRPLRDLGRATLAVSDLRGEAGVIDAENCTLSVVRHLPTRSFNSLMYRIEPRYLAAASEVDLPADLTRQLWVTVRVPEDAAPGVYEGALIVRPSEAAEFELPIRLRVLPFALEEADFITGFFGIQPDLPVEGEAYDKLQREIFAMFLDRGFTSFTGGPPIAFGGLDESGEPILDFEAADAFIAAAREAGFHREFNSYGSFVVTGLYERYGYVKGQTAAALESQYGLPYEEIARRVWAAVEEHARERDWLPFTYALCDETRVLEQAEQQIELMRLLNRVSSWLRTAGSYSVSFAPTEDPLTRAHQEFFRTLDMSMLNNHDEAVMAKARELGKEVYIYNQGKGRYSFGVYQWSERAKGVGGRYEWIAFIRHGYEYFDLDGREPDTGAIYYASDGLRSTPRLEQAAEGMNDFRYLQTLENLAVRAERSTSSDAKQAAAEARRFLAGLADRIAIAEREQPEWLDLDAVRAEAAERIGRLLEALGWPS